MELQNFEVISKENAKQINSLVLAFIGDSVHTLFIRNLMIKLHNYNAGKMHVECAKYCKAQTQSLVMDKLFPFLTDEEKDIAMRARNAKNSHYSKNSSLIEYKKATAFEAVVGYLYLLGNNERLDFILNKSVED